MPSPVTLAAAVVLSVFGVLQAHAQTNPCEGKDAGDAVGCNVANQLLVCRETAKGILAPEPNVHGKCQVHVPKQQGSVSRQSRPQVKFNPPPKHKLIEPPSPYISPSARSAHEAQCRALQKAAIDKACEIEKAAWDLRPGALQAATREGHEMDKIAAKCPQLGPKANWPAKHCPL